MRAFILSLLITGLCACAGNEREKLSYYDEATQHIEDGNFEYAIALMADILKDNPLNQRARVIMASAYAARGGIYLNSYVELIKELINTDSRQRANKRASQALLDLQSQTESEDQKKVLGWLVDANKALAHISNFLNAFEQVPSLATLEDYKSVREAVRILSEDQSLHGGPLIYRAFLRVVLFKHHLENHYRFSEVTKCHLGSPELKKKIGQLKVEVNHVLMDLSNGIQDPKKSARLKKNADDMDKAFDKAGDTQLPPMLMFFGARCE